MAEGHFCENCGAELHEGAQFCGQCGHTTPAAAPTASMPAGPPPAAATTAAAATAGGGGMPSWLVPVLVGAVVLALIGAGVAVIATSGGDNGKSASAETVRLEPINNRVPNPFTPASQASPETAVQPSVLPAAAPASQATGGQVNGNAPGLYGGSGNAVVCNREQLIAFLEANPAKAAAWAGVIGITPAQIRDYVMGLTPLILTADTLVLNHGYFNGRATPHNAILQAGTAVLVDKYGVPRVKCNCGNPLGPPTQTKPAVVIGTRWPGFSITRILVVVINVVVKNFVLINLTDGTLISRPPGTDGTQDGPVLIDDLCDLFPDDPRCAPTTTTAPTVPPSAPHTPSAPTPVDPCTIDPYQYGCPLYVPPEIVDPCLIDPYQYGCPYWEPPTDYYPPDTSYGDPCDPYDPAYDPDQCAVG